MHFRAIHCFFRSGINIPVGLFLTQDDISVDADVIYNERILEYTPFAFDLSRGSCCFTGGRNHYTARTRTGPQAPK